jgi:hypothetical protein
MDRQASLAMTLQMAEHHTTCSCGIITEVYTATGARLDNSLEFSHAGKVSVSSRMLQDIVAMSTTYSEIEFSTIWRKECVSASVLFAYWRFAITGPKRWV